MGAVCLVLGRFLVKQILLVALALATCAGPAFSEAGTLTGKALRKAVSGRIVTISTAVGVPLAIRYRGNGTMTSRARAVLAAYTGSRNDRGVWWISGNRLCQRWSNWLDGKSYCYRLHRRGKLVHWVRSDGRTGTAIIGN